MNKVFVKKYCDTYKDMSLEIAEKSFNKIQGNVISSKKNKMHAIFLRLDDYYFNIIKNNPQILKDPKFISKCFTCCGKNIHLIKAFGEGYREFREIIKTIKLSLKPKTLTWFRDDFKRLHFVKGA